MASHIWIGGAPTTAQVKTVTIPTDVEAGQVFKGLIGVKTFSYTFPAGITRTDAILNIVSEWNASDIPEVAEIQASAVYTTAATPELTGAIKFTARTAGKDFDVTFTIGDGGNEIQVITLTGTVSGGTFTLTFDGYTTGNIAFDASAATVETALEALTSIGAGNVSVSGSAGGPWTVEFISALAATDVDLITFDATNLAGTNEVQTVSIASNISGGTFTLSFATQTTAAIAYNATAATVQTELEALSLIGSGNVSVSGSAGGPYTVTFQGTLAKTDVATLYLDDTSLTGGLSVSIAETTAGGGSINERHIIYLEEGSGVSAVGTILGDASVTAGTFVLNFDGGRSTAAIAYDANVETIQDAIKAAFFLESRMTISVTGSTAGTSLAAGGSIAIYFAGESAEGATFTITNSLTGGTYSVSAPSGGISPTGTLSTGSYYLEYDGVRSPDISIDATQSQIIAALEDMSNVGAGNVQINKGSLGSAATGGGYEIEFIGALANRSTGFSLNIGSNSGATAFASLRFFKVYTGGGGTDEVQTLSISGSPGSGQFALEYEGVRTALLDYNATAAEVQTALRALTAIGSSGCSCSGGDLPGTDVVITFSGELAGVALSDITAADGTTIETTTGGGNPSLDIETTQAPLTTVDTTANSGPNNWNVAANWSSNSVPVASDTVYISDTDISILYGLDQSAVTLAALHIDNTFTGTIGLPRINTDGTAYYEYREQYLKISATNLYIGDKDGDGSERIKINLGSVQTDALITDSGTSPDGNTPAILLLGTHASNVININRGSLGIAYYPTETATVATLRQAFIDDAEDDTSVFLGDGVTVTNITKTGGILDINSGTTSFKQTAGTTTIHDGAHTVLNILSGTLNYNSTGTLTAANLSGDAVLIFDQDARPKDVTIINKFSDESEIYDVSGSIASPVIDFENCGDLSTIFMGKDFKLTFGATT